MRNGRRRALMTLRDLEQAALSVGERHLAETLRALQEGDPIPAATTDFLKGAIRRFFSGEDAAKAFDLNSKPGARGVPASVSDQVAREVWGEQYYGANYEEAVLIVATRHGLARNTVTSYYKRSKRCGGVPERKRLERPLCPPRTDPVNRQHYLDARAANLPIPIVTPKKRRR